MKKRQKVRKKSVIGKDELKKYFFWAFIIILLILSYSIIKPYLVALISAFILAYLVRPLTKRLEPKIGKSLSAFIAILLVILILIVPIGLIIKEIIRQTYSSGETFGSLLEKISSYPLLENLNIDLESLSNAGISLIAKLLTSAISYIPSFIIALFITLFGMYYILINWDDLALNLKRYIPFQDKEKVSKEISEVTNILVYGTLLIAIIEFIIAGLGFYIVGIRFYLLLAILIFFLAFIPALGPAFVWVPLTIYYLVTQQYYLALGVLIIGLILSIVIDSILRAKFLGGKANINPVVMLVGLLGGISVFGIFGFVIGPLILSYTLEVIEEAVTNH